MPSDVVSAAERAIAADPDESLAALYGHLVSSPNRRALGTFFTPSPEVGMMLDMWERSEQAPSTVADVGAGVGVFTALAAARWPDALVFGVDINPVTLGLLALRAWMGALPLAAESGSGPGIRLVRDDFTSWVAGSLEDAASPRLILGNPPYTRWQLLSQEDRVRLIKAANGLCGSRASLSTLITAISLRHLRAPDGLCLLLPAQWLESHYAAPLRDYLAGLSRRRVELRLVESKLFPDAEVDAVALLVGRERVAEQNFYLATLDASHSSTVDRKELVGKQWRAMFSSPPSHSLSVDSAPSPTRTGSKLSDFCIIRRGIATGANSYFVLSDSEAVKHDLPDSCLSRLVRRLNGLPDTIDEEAFEAIDARERRQLLHVRRSDREDGNLSIDT